jgi:DNA-binding PadR family transcriptional regulator
MAVRRRSSGATSALILELLGRCGRAFASDLVALSDGRLKRGSVYTVLGRLEDAGLVKSTPGRGRDAFSAPRPAYELTEKGRRALAG